MKRNIKLVLMAFTIGIIILLVLAGGHSIYASAKAQKEIVLSKCTLALNEAIIKEIRSIVASAQITDPEYALMTQQEQISYTVRRYNAYHQSLQTIEKMLNTLLNHTSIDSPEQKPDA